MRATICVRKLESGYLVSFPNGSGGWESKAACTTPLDLCRWISDWTGADLEIHEPYRPITVERAEPLHETCIKQADIAEQPATPPQEPEDAQEPDPAPETPEEPKTAPSASQRPSEEIEAIAARQTIDSQAARLVGYLDKRGASKGWVKASYTDISKELDVTAPVIQTIVAHAKEKFPRLRVVRVMAGEARGNNFTFNQNIPEPDAPIARVETPTQETPDDKVLNYLRERREESGLPEFTAKMSSIAKATGLKVPAVVNIAARLSSKGIVSKVREEGGVSVWRFADEAEAVAA